MLQKKTKFTSFSSKTDSAVLIVFWHSSIASSISLILSTLGGAPGGVRVTSFGRERGNDGLDDFWTLDETIGAEDVIEAVVVVNADREIDTTVDDFVTTVASGVVFGGATFAGI